MNFTSFSMNILFSVPGSHIAFSCCSHCCYELNVCGRPPYHPQLNLSVIIFGGRALGEEIRSRGWRPREWDYKQRPGN